MRRLMPTGSRAALRRTIAAENVAADDFGLIDTLGYHFDEPFADASALPTYRLCELAREEVTVALSGDGADEALAGYRRHVFHQKEERVRGLLPQSLRAPLFGTLGRIYPKADWAPRPLRAKTTLQSLARTGPQGYSNAVSITNPGNAPYALFTAHAWRNSGLCRRALYGKTDGESARARRPGPSPICGHEDVAAR